MNKQVNNKITQAFTIMVLWIMVFTSANAARIKDITSISGVRSNQLIGYGLVVGLDGTGDKTNQAPFALQSFNSMLKKFGINVPAGARMDLKNVAAVAVHADLPAFAKPGQQLDITVSTLANSSSLRGGTLLMTPLKGADGKVYAIAQGNLVVGGFGVEGADQSRLTVNVPTVGRIPNGASVELASPNAFAHSGPIIFNLNQSDFTTAKRVAEQINDVMGPDVARPMDATSIQVNAPLDPAQKVTFLSLLENMEVDPGEEKAKVVINSRTGTIVVGKHVSISPVAVTHGSLTVTVAEEVQVNNPGPLGGQTVVLPQTQNIQADEENSPMFKLAPGPTLDDIVRAVNNVGASPSDLMAILEALKQSGALKADLVVI